MSTQNTTPTPSPNPLKPTRAATPSTPPAAKTRKRLLVEFSTPDPSQDVPFSPGLKRSSAGLLRSLRRRLNDAASPYSAASLLKTPGNPDSDSDGRDTPRQAKLMKTPQYFSPGRRLFAEDHSPNKKELGEISSQLKSRLSLAFGSLQQKEKAGSGISPVKLDFANGPYASSHDSPTRMADAFLPPARPAAAALNRTNINLQTLQASPRIGTADLASQRSHVPGDDTQPRHPVSMPSPDEESSAHNALMVALSRAKERRKSQNSEFRRPSFGLGLADQRRALHHMPHAPGPLPPKLPPISVISPPRSDGASEQEAVYSLMSLSSPQANKQDLHALQAAAQMQAHSRAEGSEGLSRSSSVAVSAPPSLAVRNYDDDETDVEDGDGSDSDMTS
ncbi:hypothetical protein METBIDRAFT_175701 [Metschnikowia bicuspidata var. bicuspidata NRRL YB-4993]|uniref:Uncharacterized protein n=1 Tax=Metschnikowia bicuspidata var. bicuspidata NRRL YB-4993 TaxID=869754 RepID=A0A1A0HAH2_9ASCO|nr:hypothetical protein METBIDRAFT_175701 [Metschnikowia bicuspidata var. bicuspidata NRRL YB-4993]OBA21129.1 hypothetical protein METBIDRAFT_175701 [Metschnikowia bicuspidata var. bicuspidata NRRL YB-4993]